MQDNTSKISLSLIVFVAAFLFSQRILVPNLLTIEDGSPDTPEQVLTKLQELKDAWLDVKKIKGNENLATLDILNRAIEILDRRTQFLLHKEVGARVATDTFTTTGGAETITLTYTPLLILVVDVNGQVLSVDASDYSLSGKSLTLLNAATPSGLYGKVAYSY